MKSNWPEPSSIKELQRFLGFANFYRKFIADFSLIASPITSLQRNQPKSLSRSSAATKAFTQLKEASCTTPNLPFVVEGDLPMLSAFDSTNGVAAAGVQAPLPPCAFFSQKLSPSHEVSSRRMETVAGGS